MTCRPVAPDRLTRRRVRKDILGWLRSVRWRYHQQYLSSSKNPNGYCPDHGTGVSCPIGVVSADG
jgi:hypothetical protein